MWHMISIEPNDARLARPHPEGRARKGEPSRSSRPYAVRLFVARTAFAAMISPALFGFALPSHAATEDSKDLADLRRMLREIKEENRELSRRLGALERTPARPAKPLVSKEHIPPAAASAADNSPPWISRWPAQAEERPTPVPTAANSSLEVASPRAVRPIPEPHDTKGMRLDQRVEELEIGWAAQEHATRQIIQNALSKTGPNINSFIALSGAIDMVGSRSREFGARAKDNLTLGTAELDFDIKLSNWLVGALVLGYERGSPATFPITTLTPANVDRFTLDRTHVVVGDLMRFPITARFGQETLPFGTSTGVARLDTLSIGTPLTTEVFENRQATAGLEFAFPTPELRPPSLPVVAPPVRPLVVAPAVYQLASWLGYRPLPQRPPRLTPLTPLADLPPFYGSFMVYKGSESIVPNRTRIDDYNTSLGYRARGHCGVTYEELRSSPVCPWTFDFHVDYNTSVFESRFLHAAYLPFLDQIGRVPGMAASLKSSFGPFALVGEFNSALKPSRFVDQAGIVRDMTPLTWQVSLAYQFDWNPWVTEIGAQGNFISVGYSRSQGMAGASNLRNGALTRVGFVPESRLFFTAGEWVMDGLKVDVEYSAAWDYPIGEGGTGEFAQGVFGRVQLNF